MTSSNFRAASTARTRPHKSGAPQIPSVFPFILWNSRLAAVSCAFCRPHLPKVLCGTAAASFLTSWSMSANRAFGTVRSPFCRQSSHIEARNRGNAETETLRRRPQKPHDPKKTECFAHKSVSPVNSHTSKIVTLLCCFHTWAALAHHVFAMMTGL